MFAVIMAGGAGTRFWPLSRRDRPKQFLPIGTPKPLLRETIDRLDPLVPADRVYVVAGERHARAIRALVPELPADHLLVEPCPRNTAPCVGLAAIHLARKNRHAVMAVLPADHHVADGERFRRVMAAAAERARAGEIVTLGIRPTRPETGYGYIRFEPTDPVVASGVEVCRVEKFVEKPPREVAARYLASNRYLWNSGMFFFTPDRILADIRRFMPSLAAGLDRIAKAIGTTEYGEVLAETFAELRSTSIDYGVMEHATAEPDLPPMRVVPADFGWNDVGHWAAVADFAETDRDGNVVGGDAVLVDTRDSIVHAAHGTAALVGVSNLVVVTTEDAVLVCPRDRAQDVRKVVERLERDKREELL